MTRAGFFAVDSLASIHVLVVDDDPAFRDVLGALLRYCGGLVTPVTTPEEALIAMDQVKPDLLLFTVSDRARSFPGRVRRRKPEDGGEIPIVAVLREGDGRVIPEGTTAHVTEPINPWELSRMISTLVTTG
jgi:CheY-like chemotaxis protein